MTALEAKLLTRVRELRRYGKHHGGCDLNFYRAPKKCNCGWEQVRASADRTIAEAEAREGGV